MVTIEAERQKRKRGLPSELIDLLIAYDWNKNFKLGEHPNSKTGNNIDVVQL